jgi:hypothetical protein
MAKIPNDKEDTPINMEFDSFTTRYCLGHVTNLVNSTWSLSYNHRPSLEYKSGTSEPHDGRSFHIAIDNNRTTNRTCGVFSHR